MEISFNTAPGNLRRDLGYGVASYNIIKSLQALGHIVPYDSRKSPVQINFAQPEWWHLRRDQYSIGYTPWESSEIPPFWPEIINKADEFWTTSEICKQWFIDSGIKKDIKVYPHGISDIWEPKKRIRGEKLRFLHIGEPAVRKGGQMAMDAFIAAFGNQKDVSLTIKAFNNSNIRMKDKNGNILGSFNKKDIVTGLMLSDKLQNVVLHPRVIEEIELLSLYWSHHALIYPSWGEGFGFIPLQGIATGLPSVVTEWWCQYSNYTLPLDYKVVDSPWPQMHHGQVSQPDFDQLVWWYRELYDNYEVYANKFFNQAQEVKDTYNWINLTKKAFEHIDTNLVKTGASEL